MPENTKQKTDNQKCLEEKAGNSIAENAEANEKGNWSEDQKEKSYYYDDAYGYEIYNPDEDDEDAEIC